MLPPLAPRHCQVRVPLHAASTPLAGVPALHAHATPLLQLPLTGQAALAFEQPGEFAPPFGLWQVHVRVVPQPVSPLSLIAVPAVQPRGVLLLHTPAIHAALLLQQLTVKPVPVPEQYQVAVPLHEPGT